MGIDGDIRTYLQAHSATAGAWIGGDGMVAAGGVNVEIVDILTEMHLLRNYRGDNPNEFTGEQFYRIVRSWITKARASSNVGVFVICMDYQPYVPQRKHAEQKRRAAARASANKKTRSDYRSGSLFDDAGIREKVPLFRAPPSKTQPAVQQRMTIELLSDSDSDTETEPDPDAKVEMYRGYRAPVPFDMRVVLRQRKLRSLLMEYLAIRMRRDAVIPGMMVFFDYNNVVQVLRCSRTGTSWQYQQVKPAVFTHKIGESDLKILFWLRVFHNHPCWVRSTDGDMMPLVLQYLKTTQPARSATDAPVYWIYKSWRGGKKDTGGVIRMHDLLEGLHQRLKWETEELMMACIFCGTDYFEKSSLFYGIGYLYVLYAVQQSREQVAVLFRVASKERPSVRELDEATEALQIIVRRIYNLRILHRNLVSTVSELDALAAEDRKQEPLPPSLVELQQVVEKKKWKKMSVPTEEALENELPNVLWHIHYWSTLEFNSRVTKLDYFDQLLRD